MRMLGAPLVRDTPVAPPASAKRADGRQRWLQLSLPDGLRARRGRLPGYPNLPRCLASAQVRLPAAAARSVVVSEAQPVGQRSTCAHRPHAKARTPHFEKSLVFQHIGQCSPTLTRGAPRPASERTRPRALVGAQPPPRSAPLGHHTAALAASTASAAPVSRGLELQHARGEHHGGFGGGPQQGVMREGPKRGRGPVRRTGRGCPMYRTTGRRGQRRRAGTKAPH